MKNFLVVIGIGYALGALFAPKKGSELRKALKEYFESKKSEVLDSSHQLFDTVVEQGDEIREEAENRFNKVSGALNKAKKLAKESVAQLGEGAGQLMGEGHSSSAETQS